MAYCKYKPRIEKSKLWQVNVLIAKVLKCISSTVLFKNIQEIEEIKELTLDFLRVLNFLKG